MDVEGGTNAMISVAVVGGERLSREGLVAALQREDGLIPRDAGPIFQGQPCPVGEGEVLVVVASPRDGAMLQVGGTVGRRRPPLVLVSVFEDRSEIVACIDAGYLACVSSEGGVEPLIAAIRSAHDGIGYLCPCVADVMCRPASSTSFAMPRPSLSEREHDVLRLVAQGMRSAQIARCATSASRPCTPTGRT